MAQKFEIQPYIGIGDIKFGMRPVDVDNLIGPPSSVKKDFLGERTEYRRDNGLLVTYSENQGVVEIGCSRSRPVRRWQDTARPRARVRMEGRARARKNHIRIAAKRSGMATKRQLKAAGWKKTIRPLRPR